MSRSGSLLRSIPPPASLSKACRSTSAGALSHICSLRYVDTGIGEWTVTRQCCDEPTKIHSTTEARLRGSRLAERISFNGLLLASTGRRKWTMTLDSPNHMSPNVGGHRGQRMKSFYVRKTEQKLVESNLAKHSSTASEQPCQLEDVPFPLSLFDPSKEEYHDLVNTYPNFPGTRRARQPSQSTRPDHFPLAPRLVLPPSAESDNVDLLMWPTYDLVERPDPDTQKLVKQLRRLLSKPFGRVNLAKLWRTYASLPAPRPRHLHPKFLGLLFRHLTWVEYKHEGNAQQRFMTLMNDCRSCKVVIHPNAWNMAISYAARQERSVTRAHVREAIELWQEMESSGQEATQVTFNILYDAAVRAGLYGLADTLHTELVQRKMPLNRFFRTAAIFHAGFRKSGDAVRAAFRDLVDAGEIVDTAVMNCVVLSLVRCGEGEAAENVLQRMKDLVATRKNAEADAENQGENSTGGGILHGRNADVSRDDVKSTTTGPRTWQGRKELGHVLDATAEQLRKEKFAFQKSFFGTPFSTADRREQVQARAPIAPDARTYRILIQWHLEKTADWLRAKALLEEMKEMGIHVYGGIYGRIFKAFGRWGGFARSDWSLLELEHIWKEFANAVGSATAKNMDQNDAEGANPAAKVDALDEFLPLSDISLPDDYSKLESENGQSSSFNQLNHNQNQPTNLESESEATGEESLLPWGGFERFNQPEEKISASIPRFDAVCSPRTSSNNSLGSAASLQSRLREWPQFDDLDHNAEDVPIPETERAPFITPTLAQHVLHAFLTCAGSQRMEEVREEIGGLGMETVH